MKRVKRIIKTGIGPITIVASSSTLYGVFWSAKEAQHISLEDKNSLESLMLDKIETQIKEYLAGIRQTFDITFELEGTDFQKKVWKELTNIPFGQTRSYKDIAQSLKDANACRAVGTANGKNPISIIIPCHRVINQNGMIGGYAGGVDVKQKLLELESKLTHSVFKAHLSG